MSSIYYTFESIHKKRESFAERIGPADEITSALGHVTVGFSWLEKTLEDQIARLSGLSTKVAPAFTAEMSFKTKVAVLSSLVRVQPPLREFNCGRESPDDIWNDLVRMLCRAEELRNRIVHSHWSHVGGTSIRRTKATAKASHGVRIRSEDMDSGYILDVYDYMLCVDWDLKDFFIDPLPPDAG